VFGGQIERVPGATLRQRACIQWHENFPVHVRRTPRAVIRYSALSMSNGPVCGRIDPTDLTRIGIGSTLHRAVAHMRRPGIMLMIAFHQGRGEPPRSRFPFRAATGFR
jgi:hypothetical protein